jgi:V8-like Glu-specific endopeptidase
MLHHRTVVSGCLLVVSAIACGSTGSRAEKEYAAATEAIVDGKPATDFPEAALLELGGQGLCSGAMIAPKVVLTAGHCVLGATRWNVEVPSVKKSAKSTRGFTTYRDGGDSVDPNSLDVAVIILDTPIDMPSYVPIVSAAVANGTSVVNVGRVKDRAVSTTQLYVGQSVKVSDGKAYGYPMAYTSQEIVQSGDSGGPVYVDTGAARKIVAVNSGAGGGTQILARVDLMYAKIQELIAMNGGGGGSVPVDAGVAPPDSGKPVPKDAGEAPPGPSADASPPSVDAASPPAGKLDASSPNPGAPASPSGTGGTAGTGGASGAPGGNGTDAPAGEGSAGCQSTKVTTVNPIMLILAAACIYALRRRVSRPRPHVGGGLGL